MEKPANCSEDLYQLMRSCWETDPQRRPTFAKINEHLQEIIYIANKTGDEHIRLKKSSGTDVNTITYDSTGPTVLLIDTNEREEAETSYLTPICSWNDNQ